MSVNKSLERANSVKSDTDMSVISMDTDGECEEINVTYVVNASKNNVPNKYLCPLSNKIMKTPVILKDDGVTYDESALLDWIGKHNTSPKTNEILKSNEYSINNELLNEINIFINNVDSNNNNNNGNDNDNDGKIDDIKDTSNMDLVSNESVSYVNIDEIENKTEYNNDEIKKLSEFLNTVGLSEYLNIFLKEGFINMNDLMALTFPDLIAMNIPRLHCKRLLNSLNNLRNNNNSNNSNNLAQSMMSSLNSPQIIIKSGRIPKSKNSTPLNVNILLLGDMNVGKTSIRKRLELNEFVMTQSTQGVEITCLHIENFRNTNEDLQITIWDPAGQERYASMTKQFFRRAHGCAVVFDSNDTQSWKHVEYWLNELENNAPDDIELMLLANKIDKLFENENAKKDHRDNLIKHAINIAAEKRIPFYTTSAKSGEYIKQAFQDLISQILSNEYILKKIYKRRDGDLKQYYKNYGINDDNKDEEYSELNNNNNNSNDSNTSLSKKDKFKAVLRNKLRWKKKSYSEYNSNDYNKAISLDTNNNEVSKDGCNNIVSCPIK